VLLNDTLDFTQSFGIQFVVRGQGDDRLKPEFSFSGLTRYVDMDAIFFV
jgi:hypothetical protein